MKLSDIRNLIIVGNVSERLSEPLVPKKILLQEDTGDFYKEGLGLTDDASNYSELGVLAGSTSGYDIWLNADRTKAWIPRFDVGASINEYELVEPNKPHLGITQLASYPVTITGDNRFGSMSDDGLTMYIKSGNSSIVPLSLNTKDTLADGFTEGSLFSVTAFTEGNSIYGYDISPDRTKAIVAATNGSIYEWTLSSLGDPTSVSSFQRIGTLTVGSLRDVGYLSEDSNTIATIDTGDIIRQFDITDRNTPVTQGTFDPTFNFPTGAQSMIGMLTDPFNAKIMVLTYQSSSAQAYDGATSPAWAILKEEEPSQNLSDADIETAYNNQVPLAVKSDFDLNEETVYRLTPRVIKEGIIPSSYINLETTFDPAKKPSAFVLSSGDTVVTNSGTTYGTILVLEKCTVGELSYMEFQLDSSAPDADAIMIGMANDLFSSFSSYPGQTANSQAIYMDNGTYYNGSGSSGTTLKDPDGSAWTKPSSNAKMAVAFHEPTRAFWLGKVNGSVVEWYRDTSNNISNPEELSNPHFIATAATDYFFCIGDGESGRNPDFSIVDSSSRVTLNGIFSDKLGSAALRNAPSDGDASSDEVVLGNDSRIQNTIKNITTTAFDTGKRWDGKIVYGKRIDVSDANALTFLSTDATVIAHGITGMTRVITTDCRFEFGSLYLKLPLYEDNSGDVHLDYSVTSTNFVSRVSGTTSINAVTGFEFYIEWIE